MSYWSWKNGANRCTSMFHYFDVPFHFYNIFKNTFLSNLTNLRIVSICILIYVQSCNTDDLSLSKNVKINPRSYLQDTATVIQGFMSREDPDENRFTMMALCAPQEWSVLLRLDAITSLWWRVWQRKICDWIIITMINIYLRLAMINIYLRLDHNHDPLMFLGFIIAFESRLRVPFSRCASRLVFDVGFRILV